MKEKSLFSRLISKLHGEKQETSVLDVPQQSDAPPSLKLVFFIVDWHRTKVISEVFEEEKVRFYFVSKGRGTASSEILNLLGIGASDKAVITCLEQAVGVPVLMKEARRKLKFNSPGAGIAFTVPISAINDPILLIFKQSIHKNKKIAAELGSVHSKGGERIMANEFSNDVIMAVVNQGYSDELMNTAREAGATGGTVLNARGQASQGAVKFFGVSVQDEKEMIIILTSREKKAAIMRAICEVHGLNSKAHGIVFSMPVENVMGLSFE